MDRALALVSLQDAIERCFERRRGRIDAFTARHFSFSGVLANRRERFVEDVGKNLLNALLCVPMLALKRVTGVLDQFGIEKPSAWAGRLPPGLKTRYERRLEKLVLRELFGLPLRGELLADLRAAAPRPGAAPALPEDLARFLEERKLRREIARAVAQYGARRAAVTDLVAAGITVLLGFGLFRDAGLSVFGLGERIAESFERHRAESSFFLGRDAGSVFYGIVGVEASDTSIWLATGLVLLLLSLGTAASAVLCDPFQQLLGIHRNLLMKLLDSTESALLLQARRQLRPQSTGQ